MMMLRTGLMLLIMIPFSVGVGPDVNKKPGAVTDNRGLRTVED